MINGISLNYKSQQPQHSHTILFYLTIQQTTLSFPICLFVLKEMEKQKRRREKKSVAERKEKKKKEMGDLG